MIQIGIDTSVLIDLLDPKDIWHGPAVALKQALAERSAAVAVFDCALAEAVSTLARRIHEQRRVADSVSWADLLVQAEPWCTQRYPVSQHARRLFLEYSSTTGATT